MPLKPPAFSVERAHKTQLLMSRQIIFEDRLPEEIHLIGGVDVAYTRNMSVGAAVVLDCDSLELLESQTAVSRIRMPYIPTLLSFREIPATVRSIRQLRLHPDLFLVDGQGFAHPYRCGFASHLGLALNRPTIGVAKSRLFGDVENRETENVALLKHKDEIVGAAVTTKQGSKPVYVSVGHMVSLETAIRIVKTCSRGNRVPDPLLRAHEAADLQKRKIHIRSGNYS
jgi:deoxyribonuclease V